MIANATAANCQHPNPQSEYQAAGIPGSPVDDVCFCPDCGRYEADVLDMIAQLGFPLTAAALRERQTADRWIVDAKDLPF